MKVNDKKLKNEIIKTLKEKVESSRNSFNRETLNDFENSIVSQGYLDYSNGKLSPTEKLIFLPFKDFKILIQNIESNRFSDEEINNSRDIFIKTYEIIRNYFGTYLQKENKIFLCPYCERNYINVIDIENENGHRKVIKPDLDHFYPKSKYPYLACSIENLIPACQFCNQRIKHELDPLERNLPNPLEVKIFETISFNYSEKLIFVENKENLDDKIKKYIENFFIEEIYSRHTEILDDILKLSKKYNQLKQSHIYNTCKSFFSMKEVEDLIFHSYKHIDKKRTPLWKLKESLFNKIYY